MELASSVIVWVSAIACWVGGIVTNWLEPAGRRVTGVCALARVIGAICACSSKFARIGAIELIASTNGIALVLTDRGYRAGREIRVISAITYWASRI